MKCYVIDTLSGLFAIDDGSNVLSFMDFNDDDQKVVDFYQSIEKSELIKEVEEFLKELESSGFTEFVVDHQELKRALSEHSDINIHLNPASLEFRNFRLNLEKNLKMVGILKSREELTLKFKKINEQLIRKKVSQAGEKKDLMIIQISETLEVLKKSISTYSMRLREWYGFHFPEFTDKTIADDVLMARMISSLGNRKNFTIENLKKDFNLREDVIEMLSVESTKSMGADIDLDIIKKYANHVISTDSYREELEKYLEKLMVITAPNLKAVIGSLIGAKLISKAGSLRKLAFMPASRVQLIGAEKALYRFLKTGESRPKHGLIFQYNLIRGKKPWIRGKIARIIAGKIGIASKIDYFSGEFIGDEIANEIELKIKDIEQKYPKPPIKKVVSKPQGKGKRKGGKYR